MTIKNFDIKLTDKSNNYSVGSYLKTNSLDEIEFINRVRNEKYKMSYFYRIGDCGCFFQEQKPVIISGETEENISRSVSLLEKGVVQLRELRNNPDLNIQIKEITE